MTSSMVRVHRHTVMAVTTKEILLKVVRKERGPTAILMVIYMRDTGIEAKGKVTECINSRMEENTRDIGVTI